jgi:nitrogen regulatory protein PII
MKKIEAIIRLNRFDIVRDALADIGVKFFTLQEVKGFGLQKGKQMVYRGSVYDSDYIARLQLNIFTSDDKVDQIVDQILQAGRTGEVGDGKIVVLDINQIVRIRNGEIAESAV